MSHCLFRQNLRQCLQTCIITFKNTYHLWAFYRWINVLSFYSLFKGSAVIYFRYLFSFALFISLNFPFICVYEVFCSLGLPFASVIRMTSPHYSRLVGICSSIKYAGYVISFQDWRQKLHFLNILWQVNLLFDMQRKFKNKVVLYKRTCHNPSL
jgi:hypothetical protein